MKIKSQCSHEFEIGYDVHETFGTTLDCPECNSLLIVPWGDEITIIKGVVEVRLFHEYMHERNPELWPKDGKNTGYIEIGGENDGRVVTSG